MVLWVFIISLAISMSLIYVFILFTTWVFFGKYTYSTVLIVGVFHCTNVSLRPGLSSDSRYPLTSRAKGSLMCVSAENGHASKYSEKYSF